jgi:TM2 domain-containing membrane protein YozV
MVYILLALFLGTFGVHNFYAGRIWTGVIQLAFDVLLIVGSTVVTIFTLGVGGFCFCSLCIVPMWNIIEIVLVKKDGHGKYLM